MSQVSVLSSAADLASTGSTGSPKVVLPSTFRTQDGQITVRARIQQGGTDRLVEQSGAPEELPAMVDRVSRDVLVDLLPRGKDVWPALELDPASAQQYVDAVRCYQAQDWLAVSMIGEQIVDAAPRFGPMLVQLADAQSRIPRTVSAIEHHATARKLLVPVPAETAMLLDAQGVRLDPLRYKEALGLFGKLAVAYPDHAAYRLAYADLPVKAGKFLQALAIVKGMDTQQRSRSIDAQRHVLLAHIQSGLPGPARIRRKPARAVPILPRCRAPAHVAGEEMRRSNPLIENGLFGNEEG
ncbi:hypothetical protein [Stenotrophomonas tuberculopleuritidis]|uniref:hypothetical protein n=1 Tax=Stenotrophomonas tuberculopleuritidis TaxID=3055079 RepID=UPI0026E53D6C|nr:hypothetical protein [Stenotrophomonas sp. 704A1]